MSEDIDAETKLKLYMLMVSRYKELINENETRSVSEIRQRISPYSDTVKKLSVRFTEDLQPFSYNKHFITAAQRALNYLREIRTCKFAISFWLGFDEMDELKLGGVMDKALLLAALLRSFGSDKVLVKVTKKGDTYVTFPWEGKEYVFVPESGSLLAGDDVVSLFTKDPVDYEFNDLAYEKYGEE
ncbi:TPA: hypothetical protein EYP38_02650 [Candidatus Micrarchaeota archaeon]|nr:hypothetical protein [Candidatus Micrarchaeota archaeon]